MWARGTRWVRGASARLRAAAAAVGGGGRAPRVRAAGVLGCGGAAGRGQAGAPGRALGRVAVPGLRRGRLAGGDRRVRGGRWLLAAAEGLRLKGGPEKGANAT